MFSAKDIARRSPVGLIRKTPGFGPRSALKLLQDEDREYGYVIERGNKFVGIVSIDSLKSALSEGQGIDAALLASPQAVDAQTSLSDLLSHVGQAPCAVPVVDEGHQYIGIISKGMLLKALDREGQTMADQSNPWDTAPAADSAAQSADAGALRHPHRPMAAVRTG